MFQVFFSQATLRRREELTEITESLREENIRYRWGFPFNLIFPHQQQQYIIKKKKGLKIFEKLNLLESTLESQPETDMLSMKEHHNTDWKTVKPKSKKILKYKNQRTGRSTKPGVFKRI